jgi:hypothetical protein
MFSPKTPSEIVTITFDFTALTASVSLPTIDIVVASGGTDPSPSAVKRGSPQILGAKVMQEVQGGLDGVYYDVRCVATGANGSSRYELSDTLPVIQA